MRVRELIDALSKLPPELVVVVTETEFLIEQHIDSVEVVEPKRLWIVGATESAARLNTGLCVVADELTSRAREVDGA